LGYSQKELSLDAYCNLDLAGKTFVDLGKAQVQHVPTSLNLQSPHMSLCDINVVLNQGGYYLRQLPLHFDENRNKFFKPEVPTLQLREVRSCGTAPKAQAPMPMARRHPPTPHRRQC
jgi:hypothetical protein